MHDKDTENFKSFERNKALFLNREAFFPHLLQEALAVLGNLISARDAAPCQSQPICQSAIMK